MATKLIVAASIIGAMFSTSLLSPATACSHVRVGGHDGRPKTIARTMELNVITGVFEADVQVSTHSAGEVMGNPRFLITPEEQWTNDYDFLSMDNKVNATLLCQEPGPLNILYKLKGEKAMISEVITDGMNSEGLTISAQSYQGAQYATKPKTAGADNNGTQYITFINFVPYVLGKYKSTVTLTDDLLSNKLSITGPSASLVEKVPVFRGFGLHWAIEDAEGGEIIVEYDSGKVHVYNNTLGVMTNMPNYPWQVRNINNYANANPHSPSPISQIQTATELHGGFGSDIVPSTVGHGMGLNVLPGGLSSPSRFVNLYYYREFAEYNQERTKNRDTDFVLAQSLISTVFIPRGVAGNNAGAKSSSKNQKLWDSNFDSTQWTVIKVPETREYYIRSYDNFQWHRVNVSAIDFKKNVRAENNIMNWDQGIVDITDEL